MADSGTRRPTLLIYKPLLPRISNTFKEFSWLDPPTHFVDGEGAARAGKDLDRPAAVAVEDLHQARRVLVLLLRVAEPPVPTEPPREHTLLRVHRDLQRNLSSYAIIAMNYFF